MGIPCTIWYRFITDRYLTNFVRNQLHLDGCKWRRQSTLLLPRQLIGERSLGLTRSSHSSCETHVNRAPKWCWQKAVHYEQIFLAVKCSGSYVTQEAIKLMICGNHNDDAWLELVLRHCQREVNSHSVLWSTKLYHELLADDAPEGHCMVCVWNVLVFSTFAVGWFIKDHIGCLISK